MSTFKVGFSVFRWIGAVAQWLTVLIVLLQAMKEEPADDAKCKDKFLVQTVAVTRDMEFANVTSIVSLISW